ncbi:hypothetical protein V5799_007980 [Amblyomma americanum]|uniref:Uncharacterized protein n=1 Tax=Amblyomma americanum TaxID=6943 RepID=A0AAQ4FFS4_AMBAM
MSQYQLTLKAYVREGDKNMKKISVEYHTKLEKYEKDVRTMTDEVLALYQVVIGLMCALMSAIVIQYIIAAVYAGMNQAKRGFCGLYTASWMLSTAVVLFQLLFPIALSVSTVALAVGTVVDRRRQHDHGVGKCGMDAGKQNKTEPDPNSTSPEAMQHAKQYAQSSLSKEQQTWRTLSETDFEEAMALSERTRQGVRKTAGTAASGQEHRNTTVTPLSSEYRRLSPDSPLAQSGSKTQARDTVLEIAQRFAKCSTDHMSYIQLLGDALALQLTRRYMGAAGAPITAIIDKEKPLPNIDTLAKQLGAGKTLNLGAELRDRLTMLSDVKSVLDEVAKLSISSQTFQQLADSATQSKASFSDIDNTKTSLRGMAQNMPIDDVKRDIEKAADELDKITKDEKTGFNEQMLRDSFGDCHSIYVLYMTTVDTFCDGAVRLFSGFWFSVWWYMVLGIPGWMLALAMSTFYARLSAVSDTSTYYF